MIDINTVLSQFKDAIQVTGLVPPDEVIADGNLHRFSTNGKKQGRAGWYVLHCDGAIPAGCFGDWRTGLSENWRANLGRDLTPAEERQCQITVKRLQKARTKEKAERQAKAKEKAFRIIKESPVCTDHPYLTKKNIQAHGVLLHEDKIVVPVYCNGSIESLQTIDESGEKRFLSISFIINRT